MTLPTTSNHYFFQKCLNFTLALPGLGSPSGHLRCFRGGRCEALRAHRVEAKLHEEKVASVPWIHPAVQRFD